MNILILLISALLAFGIAFKFYSTYLAKNLGEDPKAITPAIEYQDGRDYCPTRTPVVFAHHFSSIAGAGPILGPTLAFAYGIIPIWLWIVIGGIFIGAVHDYTTLFVSLREKGKSIAEIARKAMGNEGFALLIIFTLIMVVLVTSAFLVASATALTSLIPLTKIGLDSSQHILKVVVKDGVEMGKIGGIASMSVIIITLFAPLIGFLNYRRNTSIWITSGLAIIVCLLSIIIGMQFPVSLSSQNWMILLSIYTLLAANIPVWIFLQSRDFINVFILYVGITILTIGAIGVGIHGIPLTAPIFNISQGTTLVGNLWPVLFITVACGAISGFHALVAGGTVSKQITSEKSARYVGFGGMLLESLLAVCVIIALACGINFADYLQIVYPTEIGIKSNPILAFSMAMSGLLNKGLGLPIVYGMIFGILMVEGFIATTLDTAVRLNRYLFEELWGILFKNPPRFLKHYLFNAGLSVVLMLFLAWTNAFTVIWPIFGTANQLLASLTLITLSIWLLERRKRIWFVSFPAILMTLTTVTSLIILGKRYILAHNLSLSIADVLLLLLSIALVILAIKKVLQTKKSVNCQPE